jgi:hypothetical protein
VDLLLIGMDTDTDAIRVHVPDADGYCDLGSGSTPPRSTRSRGPVRGPRRALASPELVRAHAPGKAPGPPMACCG